MGSLDDVFWVRVGFGQNSIDCKNFILLCKESNLVDDTFKDSDAETVFQKSMPLSKRRLDFPRLKDALRRVAEIRGEEEQAIHRKLIEAHARTCKPYMKRTGSLPAVSLRREDSGSSTASATSDAQGRRRSSSGTKRKKDREKKEKTTDKDYRRTGGIHLMSPSSPANASQLPFSPSGHSQAPTTPGSEFPEPGEGAGVALHDLSSPSHSAPVMPTPSSETSTAALVSIPNTPSCQYLSCPATPSEAQEVPPPQIPSTMLLPSCNPTLVMPHMARHHNTSASSGHLPAQEEAMQAASAIQAAQIPQSDVQVVCMPVEGRVEDGAPAATPMSGGAQPSVLPSDLPNRPQSAPPQSHELSAETGHHPSPKSPPVPRLPLGVCTEDGDPSMLSSRQPSQSPHAAPAKTLKRRGAGKSMTRVVSLPAPIDTGSDMAQLVSELPNSPQRSPGRAALFSRQSPNSASSIGKLDDFNGDKSRGSVEDTFKAFCGEHGDMDSKSFVRVCKKCCLLDQKFTAHDARLVFSSAVPISHVRMDLQSFEVALHHVATKRGLDMGLVIRMVSWYEHGGGPESAPATPSHEHAPMMGLPESPMGKASQRPASASRSRGSLEVGAVSLGRQSSLPNVARRDNAQLGHPDCLASPGRARSNIEGTSSLDNLAPLSSPITDEPHKVDDVSRGGKECVSPHTAPLLPLQATLPIQAQVIMPHMMVGAF